MYKIIIFGIEDCNFTKKAIDEIKNNYVFIPIQKDFNEIDEPFRSISKEMNHNTSPCIFKIKYLGGNKDLIAYHNLKGAQIMKKYDYVIFGRDSCPYTVDSLDKMSIWQLYYQYIQVNSVPNKKMAPYYHEIATKVKHTTAPCIFIIKYIGTCSELVKLNQKWYDKKNLDLQNLSEATKYVEKMNSL